MKFKVLFNKALSCALNFTCEEVIACIFFWLNSEEVFLINLFIFINVLPNVILTECQNTLLLAFENFQTLYFFLLFPNGSLFTNFSFLLVDLKNVSGLLIVKYRQK